MMERIRCLFHEEATASLVIYPDGYRCYGCGAHGPLSDLGRSPTAEPKERYRENLEETRKYIHGLPTKIIRGFNLPYDNFGYYLCFPGTLYYKRRNWEDGGAKYKNPSGHSQPPFWVRRAGYRTLAVCEGEINALSIAEAFPEWDVVSPGSASDFKADKTRPFLLTYCTAYCTVVVVTDSDGPGAEAAIHAKGILVGRVPDTRIVLCERDANEVLCESGKEALKSHIEEKLSRRL